MLGLKLRERGGSDSALETQIASLERSMPAMEEVPRPWVQKALLWAMQSAPAMGMSFAQGGVLGMTTGGAAGAMLGTAVAPATAGLSIPALTVAMASVGFAVGSTKSFMDYGRGLAYLDLRKKGVPHQIAATWGDIGGVVTGAIESAQFIALLPKIPGIGQVFRGAANAAVTKIMASGTLTTVALRMMGRRRRCRGRGRGRRARAGDDRH
jgi:hypothetical protein